MPADAVSAIGAQSNEWFGAPRAAGGFAAGSEVADLGRMLARALAAVHAHGIVHRDVKPENIIVLPERVVLIDSAWRRESSRLQARRPAHPSTWRPNNAS